jgi:hypothetical protein
MRQIVPDFCLMKQSATGRRLMFFGVGAAGNSRPGVISVINCSKNGALFVEHSCHE